MGRWLALILSLSWVFTGRECGADEILPRQKVAEAVAHLGGEVYRQLADEAKSSENLLFSPSGVGTILAIASLGTGPEATDEIFRLFGSDLSPEIFHANLSALLADYERASLDGPAYMRTALWIDSEHPAPEPFEDRVKKTYAVPISTSNFQKRALLQRSINSWVSQQTRRQIRQAVSRPDEFRGGTVAAVNALLIDAKWRNPFPKNDTKAEDFLWAADRSQKVAMMNLVATLRYASTKTEELVELPYRETSLAFVLVVPRARDGLAALEQRLNGEVIREWEKELARLSDPDQKLAPLRPKDAGGGFFAVPAERPPQVTLSIPRFAFDARGNLRETLEQAGAKGLFSPPIGNEFALTSLNQAVKMELDEEGTRVAIATVGGADSAGRFPSGSRSARIIPSCSTSATIGPA